MMSMAAIPMVLYEGPACSRGAKRSQSRLVAQVTGSGSGGGCCDRTGFLAEPQETWCIYDDTDGQSVAIGVFRCCQGLPLQCFS